MLLYTFYQPIFYATHDQHFPSDSEERAGLTEFRQPLQVQSHLEMPRILVQLGHIQRT